MLKAYTAEQIRAAEAPRLAAGEPLMARAAAGLAGQIEGVLPQRLSSLSSGGASVGGRVLLLVGSGNNGGDALFAGSLLAAAGRDVVVLPVGSRLHEAGLEAALSAGATVVTDLDRATVDRLARSSEVIVDAILGIGVGNNPALRPPARGVVETLLPIAAGAEGPTVVAVDIPSGIGPDDGSVPDEVVLPADLTVTFGGLKAGLFRQPARRFAGRVVLVDVGLADDLAAMTPALELPEG